MKQEIIIIVSLVLVFVNIYLVFRYWHKERTAKQRRIKQFRSDNKELINYLDKMDK